MDYIPNIFGSRCIWEEFYRNVEYLDDDTRDTLKRDIPSRYDYMGEHYEAVMTMLAPALDQALEYASKLWREEERKSKEELAK